MSDLNLCISEKEILQIVEKLAGSINNHYRPLVSEKSSLVVILTLKGSLFFGSDLLRKIQVPVTLDFIRARSYGTSTTSSGKVELTHDVDALVKGKHVLILDEIVDTGLTIHNLKNHLQKDSPLSISVCTLLNKPSRRKVEVSLQFVGKDVEDKFLVGYGLDYAEKYRNLKDIYILGGINE